jgi:hypothetical protein
MWRHVADVAARESSLLKCAEITLVYFARVRRGVHIAVVFLAVLLLVRPFDCFSGGKFDQKAADC